MLLNTTYAILPFTRQFPDLLLKATCRQRHKGWLFVLAEGKSQGSNLAHSLIANHACWWSTRSAFFWCTRTSHRQWWMDGHVTDPGLSRMMNSSSAFSPGCLYSCRCNIFQRSLQMCPFEDPPGSEFWANESPGSITPAHTEPLGRGDL